MRSHRWIVLPINTWYQIYGEQASKANSLFSPFQSRGGVSQIQYNVQCPTNKPIFILQDDFSMPVIWQLTQKICPHPYQFLLAFSILELQHSSWKKGPAEVRCLSFLPSRSISLFPSFLQKRMHQPLRQTDSANGFRTTFLRCIPPDTFRVPPMFFTPGLNMIFVAFYYYTLGSLSSCIDLLSRKNHIHSILVHSCPSPLKVSLKGHDPHSGPNLCVTNNIKINLTHWSSNPATATESGQGNHWCHAEPEPLLRSRLGN